MKQKQKRATPRTSNKYLLDALHFAAFTSPGMQLDLQYRKPYAVISFARVKWVHCHHGMARPRVADRGDGLQIQRVAANILNKQSRTADSGWSSSLGVGRGANKPPP
jgi:hypothetical protein